MLRKAHDIISAPPLVLQAAVGLVSSQPAASGAGLEDLADFIASNYEGMGKSAADVLPGKSEEHMHLPPSSWVHEPVVVERPGPTL